MLTVAVSGGSVGSYTFLICEGAGEGGGRGTIPTRQREN